MNNLMVKTKYFIKNNYLLIILSIIIAVFAHSYFIDTHINYDHIMVGTGDQTYQMILFKDYLYKQFTEGNFFYSFTFNGGGNFFTNLSYYYSTSLMYYLTVLITYFLETVGILSNIGVSYWANSIIVISIFRSSLILFLTTQLIEYFDVKRSIAFFGATFYAVSVIYFRHVVLWEFFADAMIWLPILLLGVEKIINKETGLIFSFGVFLAMFNNGYFAYKSFVFLFGYIVVRLFVKLKENEAPIIEQLKRYLIYGVLGAVMALPGFIPFVLGFFNTSRLSPEFNIPLTNFQAGHLAGFLFTDSAFVIPILFIILALTFYLYKNKAFRLFSLLSIVLIILRYNPTLASITNGLSYPQYRWMYFLYLLIAIAISLGLQFIYEHSSNKKLQKSLLLASGLSFLVYLGTYFFFRDEITESFTQTILWVAIAQIFLVVLTVLWSKVQLNTFVGLSMLLAFTTVFVSNEQLFNDYGLRNKAYFVERFDEPGNKYQQAVDFIEADADGFYRMDFFEGTNYSLPFEVSTFNLYSSFHNYNQQTFERNFQILSDRSSNGEYSGMGKRKILNSLLQVDYVLAPDNQTFRVPGGYEVVATFDDLNVYKNDQPLAFIHPVDISYAGKDFSQETFKDEIILNGVITEELEKTNVLQNNQSLLHELDYEIVYQNIQNQEDILAVGEDNQLTIAVEAPIATEGAIMLEYTLEPVDGNLVTDYQVNDYMIELKGAGLAYSEHRFRHRIPIDNTSNIVFHLTPDNDYYFKVHNVHFVTEEALQSRREEEENYEYEYEVSADAVNITYENRENYPMMVLPIFNELGWELTVNGEDVELLNVNHGLIGLEIPNGRVNIELQFKQPFFRETVLLALGAFAVLVILENKRTKNKIEGTK